MRFATPTVAFLLAAIATAIPTPDVLSMDWSNSGICANKGANINSAIDAFCANANIIVPSSYAKAGKVKGNALVHIASRQGVDQSCTTVSQWVPAEWCRAQFHTICANNPGGFGARNYGIGGCQHFEIKHLHPPKGKGKPKGY